MMFERVKKGPNAGEFVRINVSGPAIRETETPRNPYVSGYGKKIHTRFMVRTIDQKWRRVYVACFSNVGTAYVMHGKVRTIVELEGL